MNNASIYITVTSRQKGALAVFHIHGEEEALTRTLDARLGKKEAPTASPNPLNQNGLRYGWLRSETGELIDEVMLARLAGGMRVLMTHGGRVIREQVEGYFERNGFTPAPAAPGLDLLLASCVTEGQAAAVLAARERGETPDAAEILRQRRVVLAGPPNAGKSSLLNALAGYDRAFVDPEAGATRDVVDELIDLAGRPVWIGDMPGCAGEPASPIEAEAWSRAAERLRQADEIWFVLDASEEWGWAAESASAEIRTRAGEKPVLILLNKSDLPLRATGAPWEKHFPAAPVLPVSSLPEGNAFDALEQYAVTAWGGNFSTQTFGGGVQVF